MKDLLKDISDSWIDYRVHCNDETITGAKVKKVKKDHPIYNLIVNDWPDQVGKYVNTNKFKVESSLGEGLLSAIPWLAIMDKSITESAREGFYVVFLFSRSAKKLFLSLGIGAYQFELVYGRSKKNEKIKKSTEQFRKLFEEYKPKDSIQSIELLEDDSDFEEPISGSSRLLASSYQDATCYAKEYDPKNIDLNSIEKDLKEFISSYTKIIEDPRSDTLDFLAETLIVDEKKEINLNYKVEEFKPREKKTKTYRTRNIVFKSKNKRKTEESKKIGKAGEDHVYDYEFNKLKNAGREDLAKKIRKHYELYEFPGWDLTSYDENGNEIYIEVKSARGKEKNSLDITSNEWEAAIKNGDQYYIYIVINALNENIKILERVQNPNKLVEENILELSPSVYEIKL